MSSKVHYLQEPLQFPSENPGRPYSSWFLRKNRIPVSGFVPYCIPKSCISTCTFRGGQLCFFGRGLPLHRQLPGLDSVAEGVVELPLRPVERKRWHVSEKCL